MSYPPCLAEDLKHIPENLIILNCEIKFTRTGKKLVNSGFFDYDECFHLSAMRFVDGEFQNKVLKDIKLPTTSIPY
jgi:hypothetical protein